MAPTGDDDHYHPQDAINAGLRNGAVFGGGGLLLAAVKNSLAKKNVGPWAVFTKGGGVIAMFAAVGGVYEFTRVASANLRQKNDFWNNGIGGFCGGAVMGLRAGRVPRILGYGVATAVLLATYEYTGGTLKGYLNRPEVDEYERKEMMRLNRRRPIEETLSEIERIKEKYGIDVNPVSADPDAA
ncbi:hypothetical protein N0V88_005697 [Collariella sp. IMI 366227]|nr:hypothetical protein N0V88_005697 [Collariella sp. IMI 366227]